MLRFRARLLALVAAIALMLPSGALVRASYFCRMMERSVASCCCAHAKAKLAKQQRAAAVQAPSCCDRQAAPARAPGNAAGDGPPQVPSATLASVLPDFLLSPLADALVGAFVPSARAPPSLGPPLFLAHCSFLI
jgi:hypothetical protein